MAVQRNTFVRDWNVYIPQRSSSLSILYNCRFGLSSHSRILHSRPNRCFRSKQLSLVIPFTTTRPLVYYISESCSAYVHPYPHQVLYTKGNFPLQTHNNNCIPFGVPEAPYQLHIHTSCSFTLRKFLFLDLSRRRLLLLLLYLFLFRRC